jgi:hypothetical protein
MMKTPLLVLALLLPDDALQPWSSKPHASDAPKQHREEIAGANHAYTIVVAD